MIASDIDEQELPTFDGKALFAAGFFGVILVVILDMVFSLLSETAPTFHGSRHGLATITLLLGHGALIGLGAGTIGALLGLFSHNRRLPLHPGVILTVVCLSWVNSWFGIRLVPNEWRGNGFNGDTIEAIIRFLGPIVILALVLFLRRVGRHGRHSSVTRVALFSAVLGLVALQSSNFLGPDSDLRLLVFLLALTLASVLTAAILVRFPKAIWSAFVVFALTFGGSILVRATNEFPAANDAAQALGRVTAEHSSETERLFHFLVNTEKSE